MFRLVCFVVLLASIAFVAAWFAHNQGDITIHWLGYRFKTSMAVFLMGLLLGTSCIILMFRAVTAVFRAPSAYRARKKSAKKEAGYVSLSRGFSAIAAGDFLEARKQSDRALNRLENEPLVHLLAAQSAQLDHKKEEAHRHYTALLEYKDSHMIGVRGLVQEALAANQNDKAFELTLEAHQSHPKAAWPLRMLYDISIRRHAFDKALEYLPQLRKLDIITGDASSRHEGLFLFEQAMSAQRAQQPDRALKFYTKSYRALSHFIPLIYVYARFLLQQDKIFKAKRMLHAAWSHSPHPLILEALNSVYLKGMTRDLLDDKYISQKKKQWESLLKKLSSSSRSPERQGNDDAFSSEILLGGGGADHAEISPYAEGIMLLAKDAFEHECFDQAYRYGMMLTESEGSTSFCHMMITIVTEQGREASVVSLWEERLQIADMAERRDSVWHCSQCRSVWQRWHSVCPHCHGFDVVKWAVPGQEDASLFADETMVQNSNIYTNSKNTDLHTPLIISPL